MEPSENKENQQNFINSQTEKKRTSPLSNLSASESEDEGKKRRKTVEDFVESKETFSLPTIKIQPILGGKPLSFPVHPRLTLIDLKDFILFTLNIPHPQQILTFYDEHDGKVVLLSNFSENSLLCSIPGLIDEVTGRCAPVSLSFKMSSGMDFSINPSDIEYESSRNSGSSSNEYFGLDENEETGFFEISSEDTEQNKKLSALATSLASIIPLPPGVSKSSKMLFRSLSKSSPTNSNLPTLWEIYFPESGIKMMVTALINVSEVKGEEINNASNENNSSDTVHENDYETISVHNDEKYEITDAVETTTTLSRPSPVINAPALVISSSEPECTSVVSEQTEPIIPATVINSNEPKQNCEKCRIRCRPALRFVCKCNKTFCQSHRYPDQHGCTYDHRADDLATIQANNPKIVKDKVSNF